MKTILTAFLLVFGAVAIAAVGAAEEPRGMVVLTVSGMIGNTNRGALDEKRDSLLARNNVKFERAFAFDRAMLLSLEQGSVTVQPPEFDKPATFTGPLLREVLGYLEAAKQKVTVLAVNGYEGWLAPEDIDSSDWILALEADGAPLGLGQQGPIWLLNTRPEGEGPSETPHGHWVWAVMYMRIGD